MKIVVLESLSVGKDISWERLKKYGEIDTYETTPQELVIERLQGADIVIPNKCKINKEVLEEVTTLKLVCEAATGYNNIDLEECRKRNIAVTNVKSYSTDMVAQHTFALLLSLYEKMEYYTEWIQSGKYSENLSFTKVGIPFYELKNKKFGILGMGAIGRRVAEIAEAFGTEVICCSVRGNPYDVPYRQVQWEELLSDSDILSIHTPLNEHSHNLFGYETFCKMKSTAILLNLARGPIVVEKDLVRALNEGQIEAAGLDVFETEPLPADSPLLSIRNKDKLLLTPHVAWTGVETRNRLVKEVELNLAAFINGESRNRIL